MKAAESAKDDDIVLICDGVRPMITEQLVSNCIREAREHENAVPVTPSIDSVLESFDGSTCRKSYKRSNMFITQAPQGYTFRKILWAHEEAEKRGITNPTSSAELLLIPLFFLLLPCIGIFKNALTVLMITESKEIILSVTIERF